jgi:uncharacterized protein YqfA (UPF0365 family)
MIVVGICQVFLRSLDNFLPVCLEFAEFDARCVQFVRRQVAFDLARVIQCRQLEPRIHFVAAELWLDGLI